MKLGRKIHRMSPCVYPKGDLAIRSRCELKTLLKFLVCRKYEDF